MQPATLALIITLLPLITSNLVFMLSAYEGFLPWCMPYIDGCTTISKAARSGDSIFIFRAAMMAHAVLLIWFWVYARQWLDRLCGHKTGIARIMMWLGITGALSLMLYVDFLGTSGEMNRFMRRYGILVYFMFTPIAQVLLLRQHFTLLPSLPQGTIKPLILQLQLVVVMLMLVIGIVSGMMEISHYKTYQSENIVEWNIALLMQLYFLGMVFLWKGYRYCLKNDSVPD